MSIYDERPWLARYGAGQPADIEPEYASALEMFAAAVSRAPDADVIRYFDGRISLRELDELSDAFAVGLTDAGAPLFHITGLIGHLAISLLIGAPLVLTYRLEPSLTIDTVRETGATFTVGAITVFIALMNAPNADRDALTTLTKIYSGGAPIPPSTVKAFAAQFGPYIHNIYG